MKFDNGYRYYVLEYVLDRWIPISMHQTYHGAYVNVTAEHQVIRHLDKMVTKIAYTGGATSILEKHAKSIGLEIQQAVFFSELQKNFNEILGNK